MVSALLLEPVGKKESSSYKKTAAWHTGFEETSHRCFSTIVSNLFSSTVWCLLRNNVPYMSAFDYCLFVVFRLYCMRIKAWFKYRILSFGKHYYLPGGWGSEKSGVVRLTGKLEWGSLGTGEGQYIPQRLSPQSPEGRCLKIQKPCVLFFFVLLYFFFLRLRLATNKYNWQILIFIFFL